MEFQEIKELIQLINSSDLAYFEYKMGDTEIKMDKSLNRLQNDPVMKKENTGVKINTEVHEKLSVESNNVVAVESTVDKEEDVEGIKINSPMVGTFYISSSPDSAPFVSAGDKVEIGTTICIIEAMKLMNEIESEYKGTIVKVLVNNGDMVEYGQPLFIIKED